MDRTHSKSVSARMVDHALAGARRAGVSEGELLDACDIPRDTLQKPGARIPLENTAKLFSLCFRTLNDENLGLLHRPNRVGFFRIMALSVLNTRTLGRAMQRSTEIYNLFDSGLRCRLTTRGNQAMLLVERKPGHEILDDYGIDFTVMVLHRFFGWLCNDRIVLDRVTFDFPPPDYRDEYKYIYYGAPVLCNQEHNGIQFDSSYLDHRIVQDEESVEIYIRRAPLDVFLPLDAGGIVTQTVRKLTKSAFARQGTPPSLREVSEAMKFRPHTLRRRLADEGTSFHTIKSQVRRDIAIHNLGDAERSIEQIASDTGYSEPSAFIRAFKAWTGFTPLQFRRGLENRAH